MIAALKKLGFERMGELNATPRAPLALRFGPPVGLRLDQAYGRVSEPFDPHNPARNAACPAQFCRTDWRTGNDRALCRRVG